MTPTDRARAAEVLRELWCPQRPDSERHGFRPTAMIAALYVHDLRLHLDDLLRAALEEECHWCSGGGTRYWVGPHSGEVRSGPCHICGGRGRV